jgi:hypothetical protein
MKSKGGTFMKKLSMRLILTLLLTFVSFLALLKPPVSFALGGQQTSSAVPVTLISHFDPLNVITTTITTGLFGDVMALDDRLAQEPEGDYTFLYWESNGTILNVGLNHPFTLKSENTFRAVFSPATHHVVSFVDSNGRVLKIEYVLPGANATPPEQLPTKIGFVANGFSPSVQNVTEDRIVVLQYAVEQTSKYTATLVNGKIGELSTVPNLAYNAVVTAVADAAPEGKVFHHWESGERILSYQSSYSFTVLSNIRLRAVYANSAPAALPRIFLSENLGLRQNEFRKTFHGRIELPEGGGYSVVEFGLVAFPVSNPSLDLASVNAKRYVLSRLTPDTKEFLTSVPTAEAQSVAAYLIVKDSLGNLSTHYSESIHQIENGGFETGDLTGWTSYQVWKDESALSAFRNERVVSSANYGSANANPYDKDGNYLFGVYVDPYNNDNKDLNQERMGMLRSSDFVLGGSGYVSFKLGGGKNAATAYLSVRRSSDDVEVGRYANRHFDVTGDEMKHQASLAIATAQYGSSIANAEAFLFQYYADLTSHLGETLYLVLVDAASHEWNVLAADVIRTYLPVTPTVSPNQQAIDIKPNISGVGAAPNSITNGALTSNLNSWENPQGVFQIGNGGAISSVGGDGAVGALRSPAFSLNGTNKYLKYQFAGAVQRDKQVFVSVKEVGTNLEVLRLVRRADLASAPDSGDFKDYWFDLSGLPTNKEYYLEVVDNRNGGWGVALIRNVTLSNTTDLDYRVAVNAYYRLATVSSTNGEHRDRQSTLRANPLDDAFWVSTTPGETASSQMSIRFHSPKQTMQVEYTLASDPFFLNSTIALSTGDAYSSNQTTVSGIQYGFAQRYVHTIRLTSLAPDTEYLYRIVSPTHVSETIAFRTAKAQDGFRFVYYTDPQANTWAQAMIPSALLQAVSAYENIAFGLITGDMVERGSASLHWDWFHEAFDGRIPLLTVPGNHDYFVDTETITNANHYNTLFANPLNGTTGFVNSSYWMVYGNTLFVMIDVVELSKVNDQIAWFEAVVAAHRQDFVIVGMHYSGYGTTHTGTASTIRNAWNPVFEALNVDLVMSGHDHVYARTPQLNGGVATSDPDEGTVYWIGGSGGHKLYNVPQPNTTFQTYLNPTQSTISVITITSSAISIQTINASGTVLDTFTIPKKPVT